MLPTHTILRHLDTSTNSFEPAYTFSHTLGRGWEGGADIYTAHATNSSVVIKTFWSVTRTAPVPAGVAARLLREHGVVAAVWPADISSTLRAYPRDHLGRAVTIHATDVFYVPTAGALAARDPPQPWRLVLPLLATGSLDGLAEPLALLNVTAGAVDGAYRARFAGVLGALARMHARGFCHDDVKPDNVFLRNAAHEMLLGDMGQTRPLVHRWHAGWRDCRLVDAHRAWKSYLLLLRTGAARDAGAAGFDALFVAREADWAKAYWEWARMPQPTLPQDMQRRVRGHEARGFWDSAPGNGRVMFPELGPGGKVVRRSMKPAEAIAQVEKVRREMVAYKKAQKAGEIVEKQWWWWDMPAEPVKNQTVIDELNVISHEGAWLLGMPGT